MMRRHAEDMTDQEIDDAEAEQRGTNPYRGCVCYTSTYYGAEGDCSWCQWEDASDETEENPEGEYIVS